MIVCDNCGDNITLDEMHACIVKVPRETSAKLVCIRCGGRVRGGGYYCRTCQRRITRIWQWVAERRGRGS